LGGKSVLIVEDELILSMAIADFLQMKGFQVIEAAHAGEAVSILTSRPVDLVFTDVKMPGSMDGLELAQFIRANYPRVAIVITSGHISNSRRLSQEEVFVAKPYDFEQLCQLFEALLRA